MKKVKKLLYILLTVAVVLGSNLVSFAEERDASELPRLER